MPGTRENGRDIEAREGGAAPGTAVGREGLPEFEVVLLPDGNAVFSWNTPDIQEMACALGRPEFDPPRWCG